ncbi:hypothetical protein LWC34_39030 [Kibdelosporangium philippinense]|uniref:DUF4229 domain-containing protein n=1 Tax=Kibdelosporangium philippinense TaxID=211113 RepID=A0ABS8ZM16_9PSEU|nr:hypothetical protein [Kibdelosporangium philippinense]MCE7008765.1 hypothetical protein [Kibdelosporangium philippinense]
MFLAREVLFGISLALTALVGNYAVIYVFTMHTPTAFGGFAFVTLLVGTGVSWVAYIGTRWAERRSDRNRISEYRDAIDAARHHLSTVEESSSDRHRYRD